MARHRGPVLVDTNVDPGMLAGQRLARADGRLWGGDRGGLRDRNPDRLPATPRRAADRRRGAAGSRSRQSTRSPTRSVLPPPCAMRLSSLLDPGEQSLWAHALTRGDAWVLCGPDKASLRFGVRLGFRDRLVALEGLLARRRASAKAALKTCTIRPKWLDQNLGRARAHRKAPKTP